MIRVSHYFGWQSCPDEKKMHVVNRPRITELNKKQQEFAMRNDILFYKLGPQVSLAQKIPLSESKIELESFYRIFYYFEVEITIMEVTFLTTKERDIHKLLNNTIQGKSILSNSIYTKIQICGNQKNCSVCNKTRINELTTIIETDETELFNKFKSYIETQAKHKPKREFKLDNYTLLNYDKYQLYLQGFGKQNQLKIVRQALHFTTALSYMVRSFQQKLVPATLKNVPTIIRTEDDKIQKDKFLRTFFFFNYWTHRDLLTSKDMLNLELRTLEKNCFVYLYENLFPNDFWKIDQIMIQYFSQTSFLLLDELLYYVEKDPLGILSEYKLLFNPANFNLLSTRDLLANFEEIDLEIIYEMGKHLTMQLQNTLIPSKEMGKVTLNKIISLLGLKRGSINEKIQKRVNRLVKIGILQKQEVKKAGIKRTNAKVVYFLNREYPFTQTILVYSKLKLILDKNLQ